MVLVCRLKRWAGQTLGMKMIGGDKMQSAHTLAICAIAWQVPGPCVIGYRYLFETSFELQKLSSHQPLVLVAQLRFPSFLRLNLGDVCPNAFWEEVEDIDQATTTHKFPISFMPTMYHSRCARSPEESVVLLGPSCDA